MGVKLNSGTPYSSDTMVARAMLSTWLPVQKFLDQGFRLAFVLPQQFAMRALD